MRLLTYVFVFYLVVNNFDREMSKKLAIVIITVALAMSLLGLAQYFLGLEHSWWNPPEFIAATYVNHNHFAGFLELSIPLALSLLFSKLFRSRVAKKELLLIAALVFSLVLVVPVLLSLGSLLLYLL